MKRSDFFQFTNGSKVSLPFSNKEYENRLEGLRKIMAENNLDAVILTSLQNIAYTILVFFTVHLEDLMPVLLLLSEVLLFQQILMQDSQDVGATEKILFIQIGKGTIILKQ